MGTSVALEKTREELKMIKSKLSASQGALMDEIEGLKKALNTEKDQNVQIGNQLRKSRLKVKNEEREHNANKVKLRETAQSLYNEKREVEKFKTKLETLQMAHTTTTERFRNCESKREVAQDKLRDVKIQKLGCDEASRRMKQTYSDQNI